MAFVFSNQEKQSQANAASGRRGTKRTHTDDQSSGENHNSTENSKTCKSESNDIDIPTKLPRVNKAAQEAADRFKNHALSSEVKPDDKPDVVQYVSADSHKKILKLEKELQDALLTVSLCPSWHAWLTECCRCFFDNPC
jgi:hypothetical protein